MTRVLLSKTSKKTRFKGVANCAVEYSDSPDRELPALFWCLPPGSIPDAIAVSIARELSIGNVAGVLGGFQWHVAPPGESSKVGADV